MADPSVEVQLQPVLANDVTAQYISGPRALNVPQLSKHFRR